MELKLVHWYREMIRKVETEVVLSPILIAERIMTTGCMEDEMVAGPSTSQQQKDWTPKLDERFFDEKMCYAPQRGPSKCAMELCRTLIPVADSPMSQPPHEKRPTMETPVMQPVSGTFRASFHIHDSMPYNKVSEKRCRGCLVCGQSVDSVKMKKVNDCMKQSTPSCEPKAITNWRREAFLNGLHAGTLTFVTPAVSQAAACDGIN